MTGTNGYMLDTSAFNRVREGVVSTAALRGFRLFATHIQRNELMATPDEIVRSELLTLFHSIDTPELPTESFVIGISELGRARLGDGGVYGSLLARVMELDRKNRGPNQIRDALIAETAIKCGLILITTDLRLAQAVREHGGRVDNMDVFRRVGEI